MATEAIFLTDAKIKALRPPSSGQMEFIDRTVPGLRVRIGVSGAKSFVLRKRVAGKYRNITLGRYSERLTLADARKKARTLLSDIEFKADPIKAVPLPRKRRSQTDLTMRALWPDYQKAKKDLRSLSEIKRVFERDILPEFGDRAADQITRAEIRKLIDRIAERSPVMARNALAYLSSFFGWALSRLDQLPANPCRDAGRPPVPKARDRVLSEREIGALWHVLEAEGEPFGPAITALATNGWKRKARILKVILYGSYARGGWIDEPHTAKGYQSDFDLLIIVNDKRVTDRVTFWLKLEQRLNDELAITRALRTPVNFIVHTLGEVNDGLAHGRYFFMDVAKDGVALYQADGTELHQPKPKTPTQALAMAREYFDEWIPLATSAQKGFLFFVSQQEWRDAAFILHQATERLYHCVLLVCTFYTPLCRVRHNGVYAERPTMPSGLGFPAPANVLRVIGSA